MSLLLDALNKGRAADSGAGATASAAPGPMPSDTPLELSLAPDEPPPPPASPVPPGPDPVSLSAANGPKPAVTDAMTHERQARRWWQRHFGEQSPRAGGLRWPLMGAAVLLAVVGAAALWWVGQQAGWSTVLEHLSGLGQQPSSVGAAEPNSALPASSEGPADPTASASASALNEEAATSAAIAPAPPVPSTPAVNRGQETAPVPSASQRQDRSTAARPAVGGARPPSRTSAPAEPQMRVERDPLDILREQAEAAFSAARWDDAQRAYQAWLERQPDDPAALAGLALVLHRQQRWPEAWQAYQRAVQRWPDHPALRSGALAVLTRLDPASAESRLRDWIADNPGDALAQAALGTLLARQQRWTLAVEPLQQAVRLVPGDAVYHYNLALVLERLNRLDLALQHYRRSLALGDPGLPQASIERHISALERKLARTQYPADERVP